MEVGLWSSSVKTFRRHISPNKTHKNQWWSRRIDMWRRPRPCMQVEITLRHEAGSTDALNDDAWMWVVQLKWLPIPYTRSSVFPWTNSPKKKKKKTKQKGWRVRSFVLKNWLSCRHPMAKKTDPTESSCLCYGDCRRTGENNVGLVAQILPFFVVRMEYSGIFRTARCFTFRLSLSSL